MLLPQISLTVNAAFVQVYTPFQLPRGALYLSEGKNTQLLAPVILDLKETCTFVFWGIHMQEFLTLFIFYKF